MQDLERKQSLAKEKAVLARVITQGEILDVDEDPLEECERLASTAGTAGTSPGHQAGCTIG